MTLLGLSAGGAFLVGSASAAAVLLVVGGARAASRRPSRRGGPDIPPGMRPGPSDADLEKPVLEKLYAWGLIMVVVMALWVPAVFLRENSTNKDDTRVFIEESVQRGHETTLPFSEENQLGFDCERCHGPALSGGCERVQRGDRSGAEPADGVRR